MAEAWETPLPNKEVLRELTRSERGLRSRGYLRDEVRWVREFARRYFTVAGGAVRQADPNHLVFGCRFRHPPGAAVLAGCVYPAIDVTLVPWTDVPGAGVTAVQPVLVDDVRWSPDPPSPAGRAQRLTSFERMLRKARATLDRLARHPAVIGYAWSRWQDEPAEQPPFAGGLVHVDGREAREHMELLAPFNLRAETLRRRV